MFDIFFISYQEPNADVNFAILQDRFPIAQRVHGVKGIHQAHKEAAKKALTKMFYVVDGDALVEDDFNFDYEVPPKDMNAVHVWRSKNPVNELVYGYGGVKLLPTKLTLDMDCASTDMTTSISNRFRPMEQISNTSLFNSTPFVSLWIESLITKSVTSFSCLNPILSLGSKFVSPRVIINHNCVVS